MRIPDLQEALLALWVALEVEQRMASPCVPAHIQQLLAVQPSATVKQKHLNSVQHNNPPDGLTEERPATSLLTCFVQNTTLERRKRRITGKELGAGETNSYIH